MKHSTMVSVTPVMSTCNKYTEHLVSCFVLHHCVVIFVWSSGNMGCTCMLFSFENRVPLGGVSGVAPFITTDEQLHKTEAVVFSCRLCFLRAFAFISLILLTTAGV